MTCAITLSAVSGGVAQSSSVQERDPQKSKAVAVVNGLAVTEDQVQKAAAADLERLTLQQEQLQAEFQRNKHQALETALNHLIEEKLLDAEVTRLGTSREKLLASEVESKVKEPSDEEISAFYEANKGQIGRPKEQVAGLIRDYLKENRRKQVRSSFLEQLKQKYSVKSFFEPLRIPVESAGHPARGSAQAPVTIVEFSDFECPYCTRLTATLKEVEKNYGDKLRFVFRQFPLPIHPQAEKAAEASLCAADQGSFWEMHNLLFQSPQKLGLEDLKAGAAKLGLDKTRFGACLDSGKYADKVKKDIRDGTRAGVSGTPAMFINGRFISGAVPYDDIAKVIKEELATASARQ
ncbi:MAG TPA: thioredoxin domain-containing protein [Acidobacteriota bacterium]